MKKRSPLVIIIMMLLLSAIGPAHAAEEKIYLHCFTPTYGQAIQWDDQPKVAKPTPPARLITLNVTIGSDFKSNLPRHGHLSGKVTRVNEAMGVVLEGSYGSSSFAFSGNVQLESVFKPGITGAASAVFPVLCVLSKHKEIEPFLKAQAAADSERLKQATEQSKRNLEEDKKRAAGQGVAPNDR